MTFIKLEAEFGPTWVNPAHIASISLETRKSRFSYRVCFCNRDGIYLDEENFNILARELCL